MLEESTVLFFIPPQCCLIRTYFKHDKEVKYGLTRVYFNIFLCHISETDTNVYHESVQV